MIDLVICDMDGTLVDSMPALTKLAVTLISRTYGILADEALEKYTATIGAPFREQLEAIFPGDHYNAPVAMEYRVEHGQIARTFRLVEGWQRLRDLPCKLALVSSTYMDIIDSMYQLRAIPFCTVQGYYNGYPKEDQIAHVLYTQRVTKAHVLYVGDTASDADVAMRAGVAFQRVNVNTTVDVICKAVLP